MKKLHHPNVVSVIDSFHDEFGVSIVLEYVDGGSLSSIVRKCGQLPESLVALYMEQVLQGLQYLHENNVIHRDIKGGNILLSKEGVCKLVDFGCAAAVASDMCKRVTVVGSPYWMAPEVVSMSGQCPTSDIWSFGATVVELVTGEPPYWGMPPVSAMFHVVQDAQTPLPAGLSPLLADMLRQCFQKDPERRPSAAKLREHPWFAQFAKPQQQQQQQQLQLARDMSMSAATLMESFASAKSTSVAELLNSLGGNSDSLSDTPGPAADGSIGPDDLPDIPGMKEEELKQQVSVLRAKYKKQRARAHKLEATVKSLKETVSKQKQELQERNEAAQTLHEFFFSLCMAAKLNLSERDVSVDVQPDELFVEAARLHIPWNHWPEWVFQKIIVAAANTQSPQPAQRESKDSKQKDSKQQQKEAKQKEKKDTKQAKQKK